MVHGTQKMYTKYIDKNRKKRNVCHIPYDSIIVFLYTVTYNIIAYASIIGCCTAHCRGMHCLNCLSLHSEMTLLMFRVVGTGNFRTGLVCD